MPHLDRADLALAIAFFSLLCTAWQAISAWSEKDTPLQALVFQSQVVAIQSLTDNARISCARRICTDYANPDNEKHEICKGSQLDDAFEKVQLASNHLKLLATPQIVTLVRAFDERVHSHHAFDREDRNFNEHAPKNITDETRKFLLYNQCHGQIDEFVNAFRRMLGLEQLSAGLMSKVGDQRPLKPDRVQKR